MEDGVDDLKKKLYSRAQKPGMQGDMRAHLTKSEEEAPVRWEDTEAPRAPRPIPSPQKRMALASKFLIGSALFFVLAVLGAALFFFTGSNYISTQNIDLEIVAPAIVDGGSTVELQYLITNRNPSELKLADLVIRYPEGTRDPKNPSKALNTERIVVGTLSPGRQQKLTSSAIFYGSEGSSQPIKVALEYSIANSNAVFVKESETSITVGSSPVSVSVAAPQEAVAGQPFSMTVTVQSNSSTLIEDVVIQAQYPFGFSVRGTSPKASSSGSLWRLGTMAPGATQVITIEGTIDGQDGDERVFRFLAGSNKDETAGRVEVPYLSVPVSLVVHRPFITADIAVEGKNGSKISVAGGKVLQGRIEWQNNLSDSVSDVQIKLKLSGPILNRSSIEGGVGFYQSIDNTITWTSSQDPSLAQVAPGGRGTLGFSFATLAPGAGGVVYTNPSVVLEVSVSAVRAGQGSVPETVTSAAETEVVIASAATLQTQALHFTGGFSNSGPMPPRAEESTQYTIVWTVKNSANALGNTTISTVLPPYVTFVQGQSGITYDAGSRTVRWSAGDVAAGVGYSTAARQGAFQIALTPSASQVGQTPMLTGTSALSGTDRFAQVSVSATSEAPTTKLTESGFGAGMDTVQPKQ